MSFLSTRFKKLKALVLLIGLACMLLIVAHWTNAALLMLGLFTFLIYPTYGAIIEEIVISNLQKDLDESEKNRFIDEVYKRNYHPIIRFARSSINKALTRLQERSIIGVENNIVKLIDKNYPCTLRA